MEWSLVVAIISVLVAVVSSLITIHYKRMGEKDSTIKGDVLSIIKTVEDDVKDVDRDVKRVTNTVGIMQQELRGMRADLDNVVKDTRRLESSLEKDVKHVSEKIDEIYKMIFSLVKHGRHDA